LDLLVFSTFFYCYLGDMAYISMDSVGQGYILTVQIYR
jgi:hypothetical protein